MNGGHLPTGSNVGSGRVDRRQEAREPSVTYAPRLLNALLDTRADVLVWVRVQWQDQAPALTLYQVRLLLTAVLPVPVFDSTRALKQVLYYQRPNHAAALSHRKRKAKERVA